MRRLFSTLAVAAGSAAMILSTLSSTATPVAAQVPVVRPAAPEREGAVTPGDFTFAGWQAVATYRAAGPVRGVVIFLSGDGGWNLGVVDMAKALAEQGVAVAGISTPALQKRLDDDAEKCVNPNYALQALAQDYEHRLGLPRYIKPILAGYSSGATIAYAALAQAPAGTWRGAVSLGFGPDIGGTKPWCAIPGVTVSRIAKPEGGWLFSAAPRLPAPWLVLQGAIDQVVSPAATRAFTRQVPQAQLIELPRVGHGFSVEANWMPQFKAAFAPMLEPQPNPVSAVPLANVADLPLTIVADPAARHTDLMAVMYSGDGGWAGIDRDLAARLAAAGVPVVGVDSLSYFWNARTPAETGRDAARIVEHFAREWHRPKVIFVGYSFGADDLPYIVGNLPSEIRPMVTRVSMLGLSGTADFQFHLASWLDIGGANALPTLPAIEKLRGMPMQCIRGEEEKHSACPTIPAGLAEQVALPGGHHFGDNGGALAAAVLRGLL
nr:AcvB/VirJ family lysyl-phosphatidylglycerol hydrolase [Sphingomonas sp. Y57]